MLNNSQTYNLLKRTTQNSIGETEASINNEAIFTTITYNVGLFFYSQRDFRFLRLSSENFVDSNVFCVNGLNILAVNPETLHYTIVSLIKII